VGKALIGAEFDAVHDGAAPAFDDTQAGCDACPGGRSRVGALMVVLGLTVRIRVSSTVREASISTARCRNRASTSPAMWLGR
jgi:hypothetical protein